MVKEKNIGWVLAGFLAYILLMTSCSVQQMNNYHCKRCPTKDSISIVKERHDSIIRELVADTVPGDTIRDTVKVPCKDFKYHKETKRQKVTIEVKDGEMTQETICKEWEFKYWVTTTITTLTEKTVTIYEGKKKTAFGRFIQRWFGWFGYWQSWVCIGYVLFRLAKWILKLTGYWPFPLKIKRIKRSG
jgi:hypothetical protein